MSSFSFFSVVGTALVLTGCSLTPKYIQPEAPVPNEWPTGAAYIETRGEPEALPATELPWRAFFTDEKLQKVIETALANNRELRLAALNVANARALYGIQRDELLPTLYATSTGGETHASADLTQAGASRNSKYYDVNLGVLSWEIDFFGRIRSLKGQALETYLATEEARRGTQILLVSNVATAYLSLAAEQEALALAKETYQNQKAAFELVRKQYELEVATELDLRRAQTPVETARGDIARFTQRSAQARNTLLLLVGADVSEDLLPSGLAAVRPPEDIRAGLSSEILLSRPDIVAAEHQLKAAHAFIGAARASFFPRISLTATLGTASNELSGLFTSGTDTWAYAPQIAMPIFDARTWSAYRVSKTQRDIARIQYEKAIQTAFREVADALAVRGTVDERVAAQLALVEALDDTYRLSKIRYEQGVDSYLSMLDAQRSLFAAQQGLITLRLAQSTSKVNLYAAIGGGGDI